MKEGKWTGYYESGKVEWVRYYKDGELYKYTSRLFWGTVKWFINSYATDEEWLELLIILSKTAAEIN